MKSGTKLSLIVTCLIISFFTLLLFKNFSPRGAQHFTAVARGFMEGRLDLPYLDPDYGDLDTSFFNDKYYWTEPPFSGLILVPFVSLFEKINLPFYQGYVQFFITIGIFITAYLLSKKFGQNKINSLFLAFAFCFASIYSFIALFTESWYFSQSITVLLLMLALYEWYSKKRYAVVGLYLLCIILTRTTAIFSVGFFLLATLFEKNTDPEKRISNGLSLLIPIVLAIFLIFGYNQVRFGNIWETGHSNNNVQPQIQSEMRERYGLFKLENIPTNFYWYFLSFPHPTTEPDTYHLVYPFLRTDGWGMSFFIMSPIFFLIFKTIRKDISKENLFIWISSLFTLVLLLTWHSTGFFQIGPRYLLDLLPLWFVLLLVVLKGKLNHFHIGVIIVSSLTNLFWILQYI